MPPFRMRSSLTCDFGCRARNSWDLPQLRQLRGTARHRRLSSVRKQHTVLRNVCRSALRVSRGLTRSSPEKPKQKGLSAGLIKKTLKRVPVLGWFLKSVYACGRELRHALQGYRFLRMQDLVIVSGGGQLNEEWGGPWSHPFSLFKWAVLARIARVPYVIVSVGVGKVRSKTSRLFLRVALRLARYRSYREKNSLGFAGSLLKRGNGDSVVTDLAFSLLPSEVFPSAGIRAIAQGRPTIAISPIIYANPRFWPYQDRSLYARYVNQWHGSSRRSSHATISWSLRVHLLEMMKLSSQSFSVAWMISRKKDFLNSYIFPRPRPGGIW